MSADAAARFCYCGRCVFECDTALGLFQACEVSSTLHCNAMRTITWITCWSMLLLLGSRGSRTSEQSSSVVVAYCMVQEMTLLLLCLSTTTPILHYLHDAEINFCIPLPQLTCCEGAQLGGDTAHRRWQRCRSSG